MITVGAYQLASVSDPECGSYAEWVKARPEIQTFYERITDKYALRYASVDR